MAQAAETYLTALQLVFMVLRTHNDGRLELSSPSLGGRARARPRLLVERVPLVQLSVLLEVRDRLHLLEPARSRGIMENRFGGHRWLAQ